VFAKLLAIEFDQSPPVAGFLFPHTFEHGGRCGVVLAQSFGKIRVHALVFFFQRNGQSQHFAFRKFLKLLHGDLAYLSGRGLDKWMEGEEEVAAPSVLLSSA